MRAHQWIWIAWMAGVILVMASWTRAVPPEVGWFGFAIGTVAAVISWIPRQADRSRLPLTQEGLPVTHAGNPIPPDMQLVPGMPLIARLQGRLWRATVIQVREGGDVLVRFPGWDEKRVAYVPRKLLQLDPDPNRQPLVLPSDPLERWKEEPPSNGITAPDPKTGLRE
jgi:hypothetical protein